MDQIWSLGVQFKRISVVNIPHKSDHQNNTISYQILNYKTADFNINRRARSIFERAIEIDYQNTTLWLKYAEVEMKNKFPDHARNIWERATGYLPRIDQFWYKYIAMEEILGNYARADLIYQKWMSWGPGKKAWASYLKFLERMENKEKAREVLYKYLSCWPNIESYLKVAKWETRHGNMNAAREVYEKGVQDLGQKGFSQVFFLSWARFEGRLKEFARAREVFAFGLKNLNQEQSWKLREGTSLFYLFITIEILDHSVQDIILKSCLYS